MGHHDESCADFIERIVYLLDNELDEDDVHAVRSTSTCARPAWTIRRPADREVAGGAVLLRGGAGRPFANGC